MILQINNQDVRPPTVQRGGYELDSSKNLVVLVRRGEAAQYVPIKP